MANKWGIPKDVELAVLQRDKACVYCGIDFSSSDRKAMRSWEHIINDVAIATLDNIALCCVGCNASKGNKLIQDWIGSTLATRRGISHQTLSTVVLQCLEKSSIVKE